MLVVHSLAVSLIVGCFLPCFRSHTEVNKLFPESDAPSEDFNLLSELAARGWDVQSRLYLGFGKWRLQWQSAKTE